MNDFKTLVEECDLDIRAGKMGRAARRLAQLNTARVPRDWALPLANVCRRAGLIVKGIRLLTPIVRGPKIQVPPEPAQLAEYGVLLHRFGAFRESETVLAQVPTAQAPEALLYRAFCRFSEWNHPEALPLLEEYMTLAITPYMNLVARLNHASALVNAGRYDEALVNIGGILAQARREGLGRLEGNSHELRAQVHLHRRRFTAASEDLNEAARLLSADQSFDVFLVRKWKAIFLALKENDVAPLTAMRAEALRLCEWESAREADRFHLQIRFEPRIFRELIFGTPWPRYRELVARESKREPADREYLIGAEGARSVLDLATGEINGPLAKGAAPLTRLCHRVLGVFMRDFYSGRRVGDLFCEFFPGEYFNIFTSPGRVRQALYRTRQWCRESRIPFQITERKGFFVYQVGSGLAVRVTPDHSPAAGLSAQWEVLKRAYGSEGFSAREAAIRFAIPRTSMQRLLKWALAEGLVRKSGSSASVRYAVVNEKKPPANSAA